MKQQRVSNVNAGAAGYEPGPTRALFTQLWGGCWANEAVGQRCAWEPARFAPLRIVAPLKQIEQVIAGAVSCNSFRRETFSSVLQPSILTATT